VKGAVTPYASQAQIDCQYPKLILLNTGYATTPYLWAAHTVDIQMLRVGQLVIAVIPGELTTMAGRRMRDAVRGQLMAEGIMGPEAYVALAGPANTYSHYITTPEEYTVQRYEGASTIFGPNTLPAYLNKYPSLVSYLAANATGTPASDAPPPEQTSMAISLQTGVVYDGAPIGQSFGDVNTDVDTSSAYAIGDTVWAQFVGADPRNNLRLQDTFLSVDQQVNGDWTRVRTDAHPSTTLQWNRTNTILGYSVVNITWTIENTTSPGSYRLVYYGDSKSLFGEISAFTGTSSTFTVT